MHESAPVIETVTARKQGMGSIAFDCATVLLAFGNEEYALRVGESIGIDDGF